MIATAAAAVEILVRGVVQGVGFRPFVFRLAHAHALAGWVLNTGDGVRIHVEGGGDAIAAFVRDLEVQAPCAARIDAIEQTAVGPGACRGFSIRDSAATTAPTAQVSADIAVCAECLADLFDPRDRRAGYPYITCTNCGPRYSIVTGLPYDRPRTTMRAWPLCETCRLEYEDPRNRRFHAQPLACPACGPTFVLRCGEPDRSARRGAEAIETAARMLRDGRILAIKGIGGYHLACAALDADAVGRLRARKVRDEKPFALMTASLQTARQIVDASPEAEALLNSPARPIVIAPARRELTSVAPGTGTLGVMLPYAPLHHLLFAAGAPDVLVMTSGNASDEPMAYGDEEARTQLAGIADGRLAGERPIARRVDDSIVRVGPFGPVVLRRSRGYAPAVVARLPAAGPLLAVGADLKSAVTLVVAGDAIVSQHIGDLAHWTARQSLEETARDLLEMWRISPGDLAVVHDAHPEYVSTRFAQQLAPRRLCRVQHHRAHVASVLAERGAFGRRAIGVAFDGTGYGDDGSIWGGELFAGSLEEGLVRVAHLRPAPLPGGDSAARHPVQAAAGFVSAAGLHRTIDFAAQPFALTSRFERALALVAANVRVFETTSAGRLFDAAAALLGFTRQATFEGQAAMWLEHIARASSCADELPFPFAGDRLDYGPALETLATRRLHGDDARDLARAFHRGLARGVTHAVETLCETHGTDLVILSGGVFQNELLLSDLRSMLEPTRLQVWTNELVPPNDGGISLGQAALFPSELENRARSSDTSSTRGAGATAPASK